MYIQREKMAGMDGRRKDRKQGKKEGGKINNRHERECPCVRSVCFLR
jgi:hypothetical protein